MKLDRRRFVTLFLIAAPALFVSATAAPQKRTPNKPYLVYVGTYTNKSASKGIYVYSFDPGTGKLSSLGVAAESEDPSFLALHPSGKYLYAVNEIDHFAAQKSGATSAFSIDAKTGKLTLLNQVASRGAGPCHISLDKSGKFALVANYDGGSVASFPVRGDGTLGEAADFVQLHGSSVNKERQEGPHAHWIGTSPDNRFALVADLGLDEVLIYKFDAASGTLTPNEPAFAKLKAGSGPRHVAFHPKGKFVFVVSELTSTATSFAYDAKKGTLKEIGTVSTLPPGFSGRNDVAEAAVYPNGKFLYVSNRGNESIAILSIYPAKGTLGPVGGIPTGGKEPRHFAIDPSGKYLLAENQLSNNIVVFKIDLATGGLTPTGQVVEVPSPVDITFLPQQ